LLLCTSLDFLKWNRILCAIPNYKFRVKRNIKDSGICRLTKAVKI
jgi:hypothetical protein